MAIYFEKNTFGLISWEFFENVQNIQYQERNSRFGLNVYIMVLFLKMLVSLDIIKMKYTHNGNADRGNSCPLICV